MERNIDDLLKQSLTPTEEPANWLNEKLMNQACEKGKITMKKSKRYSLVAAAALFLGISATTVYAAYHFMTPQHVAEAVKDEKLADAFSKKGAVSIDETQTFDDYNITLLGIVSGRNLTDYSSEANGEILVDRTYCVVAIARADGTDMPKNYYDSEDFLVSPFIEGYDPAHCNVFTLDGGYTEFVQDGVLYRLMECDNIEKFAKKTVYLGVLDSTFYKPTAYQFDEKTGAITKNEKYQGVNALFSLPLDKSKADEAAVQEFETKMKEEGFITDDKNNVHKLTTYYEDDEDKSTIVHSAGASGQEEFLKKLTPENLLTYAVKIEGMDQVIVPKDGEINYSYEYENSRCSAMQQFESLFPENKPGMSKFFSSTCGVDDLKSMVIEAYTLQDDGKVLLELYKVKD